MNQLITIPELFQTFEACPGWTFRRACLLWKAL